MDVYDGRAVGLGARDGDATSPTWEELRRALGATRVVAKRLNLVRMKPLGELASSNYCLADPTGGAYLVYAPTGRTVTVDLSATKGTLRAEWIRPDTGAVLRGATVAGGQEREFSIPFDGPAVLLIQRR